MHTHCTGAPEKMRRGAYALVEAFTRSTRVLSRRIRQPGSRCMCTRRVGVSRKKPSLLPLLLRPANVNMLTTSPGHSFSPSRSRSRRAFCPPPLCASKSTMARALAVSGTWTINGSVSGRCLACRAANNNASWRASRMWPRTGFDHLRGCDLTALSWSERRLASCLVRVELMQHLFGSTRDTSRAAVANRWHYLQVAEKHLCPSDIRCRRRSCPH